MPKKSVLMLASRGSGPRLQIHDVVAIEVSGAGNDDIVEVYHQEPDTAVARDPILIKGSKTVNVLLARGHVQVKRIKGDSPVTVFAHIKR